ncbi:hypothetical protein ACFQ1S_03755 [Kibdelosporangium lantanae]|uniref:Uncharacterized protein n=1 Tax=Kibdelosporangium lantanae TaxID=1497396 RepID=A0ABW3M386_9PSEU
MTAAIARPVAPPDGLRTANHHGSHSHLLAEKTPTEQSKVEAIIVPTGRPVAYLEPAIALAKHHRCTLVLLCSIRSYARLARKRARTAGVDVIAIDMADVPPHLLPVFETTTLLDQTKFQRRTDTSEKRNLGLLLAQAIGWERIVFLDDDIKVPDPDDLGKAVSLLGEHASVGLMIDPVRGFPDNSTVCHAYRDAGGYQDTFIGGGALAVGSESLSSFFPKIYNEDWFFLFNDNGLRPSARAGKVIQQEYDPYRDPMRARSEELGDTLAEGVMWLMDNNQQLADANASFWAGFLFNRRKFLDEVMDMVELNVFEPGKRARMIESLKAARGRNWVIEPELCVDFMKRWLVDRRTWRDLVNRTPRPRNGVNVEKGLVELGLALNCCR